MPNPHLIRQPAYDVNGRPFLVIWETTQACDLSCVHCRAQAQPEHDPLALSFQDGCRLIDQVADLGLPHPLFILTGGDPFKRADIFDLVGYAAGRGLPVAVSPSGTPLLTPANPAAAQGMRHARYLAEPRRLARRPARCLPPRAGLLCLDRGRLAGRPRHRPQAADQHYRHALQPVGSARAFQAGAPARGP